jgi:hypothetical protein
MDKNAARWRTSNATGGASWQPHRKTVAARCLLVDAILNRSPRHGIRIGKHLLGIGQQVWQQRIERTIDYRIAD